VKAASVGAPMRPVLPSCSAFRKELPSPNALYFIYFILIYVN